MKKLIAMVTLLTLGSWTGAQEIRTEIVKPTTVAEDSKPNSDAVPDVYSIAGQFDRVLVVRLKYQTDLLGGLERAAKTSHIHNAVILSGIGSVRGYHIHSVSNRTFPSRDTFVKNPTAPADLVSVNGYIIDGRIHAHVTLANADKAFGGHLEPGTEVFTFAIITIGVLNDKADLSHVDDKTYR